MQRNDTQSTVPKGKVSSNHAPRFMPALDTRKRKIRGLWTRNGRYYAQMRVAVEGGKSKPVRVPLKSTTLEAARGEAEERRTEKTKGELHLPGKRPKFCDLAAQYRQSAQFLSKKPTTRLSEEQALNRWVRHLGETRIDWIKTEGISGFRDKRKKEGVSNRTINLDVVAFTNAMKYAADQGLIAEPPKLRQLKQRDPLRRPLLTKDQIDSLLFHAEPSKNAAQFRLYLRFLISAGPREQEALKIRKSDVDLAREVVRIGGDGDTKNSQGRDVQFNTSLRDVLTELMKSLPDDTIWLFPSPQRGKNDRHAMTFRETLRIARKGAKLEWVGFHDFRHFFASQCVMAGIDYMTIAKWMGHQDGGILVGKVYGHINDEHQRSAAKKLKF